LRPVIAENLIDLANVGLAGVKLLPFPDRTQPYIKVLNSLLIGFPGQAAMEAEIIVLRLGLTVLQDR
jgi:hypothetical protein